MPTATQMPGRPPKTAGARIRREIESHGERLWRLSDFRGLSPSAVASKLSRMARDGKLRRVGPGVYYWPRSTILGESTPSQQALTMAKLDEPLQPSGLTAAALLGFTTQNPAHPEYATPAEHGPRGLTAKVSTRRPDARRQLTPQEGAILEFLRDRGETSDLSTSDTIKRLLDLLGQGGTFDRLMEPAMDEPPRVRAMLGALGQEIGVPARRLQKLRRSLGPVSKYDFGGLRTLRGAKDWQAK